MATSKKLLLSVTALLLIGGFFLSLGCGRNNPPMMPSDPEPPDGVTIPVGSVTLCWCGGDPDPELPYYDVYFGDSTPPPLEVVNILERSYEITDLESNTTYYWMIVAQDEQGDTTAGPIWSFTTLSCTSNNPPLVPSNPWPSNGASGQPRSLTLRWSGGDPDPELPYYDVYLGTTDPPPLREVNLIEKYCEVTDLDSNTTYYWMIVAQDEQGDTAAGPVWSFSTSIGDSYEPNNNFSSAYGPLEFGAVYESWIWNPDDYYDFYYFIPDSSGRVKIDLYSLPADYDLALFDENQEELDWSANEGITDESISCFVTESDIYYVVVFQYAPADSTDSYLLKVDYDTAQAKDSYEPNDFFDEAYGPLDFEMTYESWISTPDDEDYYYFVPASDGWIEIDLYDLPEDYDLYLCDSNYDLIDASENEANYDEWIEFEGSASETYYVIVVPYEGYDAFNSYYLEVYYSYGFAKTWGLTHREKRNLKID